MICNKFSKNIFGFLFILFSFTQTIFAQNEIRDIVTSKLGIGSGVVSGAEVVGGIFRMHTSSANYTNKLSQITNFEVKTKDPEELVRFYTQKIEDIKREAEIQREKKKQEIDALAKKLADGIADIAKKAGISTGNAFLDLGAKLLVEKGGAAIAKANADKQIAAEQAKAKMELDNYMKKTMSQIKIDIINDNTSAKEEYLKAAAECFSETDEKRYFDYLKFHECLIEQIEKNYTWENADWIKTSCTAPPRTYGFSAFTKPESDYMAVAKRKYKIYTEQYKHQSFLDGAKRFTEAALAENKNNPDAYAFMAFMSDDIIDKYMYINFAQFLLPSKAELIKEKKIVKFYFTKEFFKAIKDNNIEFIHKSVNLKFHLDLVDKNNNSPTAAAINDDRDEISGILLAGATEATIKECYNYAITKDAGKTMTKFIALGYKLSPNAVSASGIPLLYLASSNNADNAGRSLVEAGIDLGSSLAYAKTSNNAEALKKMCQYIMDKALETSNIEFVNQVLAYNADIYKESGLEKKTYLELAVQKNSKEIFQLFITKGVDLNAPPINSTSLMEMAISNKANDIARVMLELGINLAGQVTGGGNLINFALFSKNPEIVPDLIAKKLSVSEVDLSKKNPLYYAISAKDAKTFEMLLINGANADFEIPEGGTLLHLALKNENQGITDLILTQNINVDKTDKSGNTPIMMCMLKNDLENAQKILLKKPNLNLLNQKKWAPLHYAAWKGYNDFAKKLIAAGANVNIQGEYGWTPLHYAVRENKIDMVVLLFENYANKNIADEWKRAPLKIAKERQFKEMKKVIRFGKKV